MSSPTSNQEEQIIITHRGFSMKPNFITTESLEEQQPGVFIDKTIKPISQKWIFWQIVFRLWIIYVKLTRRKFKQDQIDFEKALSKRKLSGNLIDIGGGEGWMSRYWKSKNKSDNYVICDPLFRTSMLKQAKYQLGKMRFVQCYGEDLPIKSNSFDTAIIAATIDHVENPRKTLKETARVLREGGKLLMVHKISQRDLSHNLGHIHRLDSDKLTKIIKKFFTIDESILSSNKEIVYIWASKIGA